GVTIQDVNSDIADSVGLKTAKGALVTDFAGDSPGAKAGLKSGDIITAVDGQAVDDAISLSRIIAGKAPGTSVELTLWRDRAETKLTATLGELGDTQSAQPDQPTQPDEPASPAATSVGITVVPNGDGD